MRVKNSWCGRKSACTRGQGRCKVLDVLVRENRWWRLVRFRPWLLQLWFRSPRISCHDRKVRFLHSTCPVSFRRVDFIARIYLDIYLFIIFRWTQPSEFLPFTTWQTKVSFTYPIYLSDSKLSLLNRNYVFKIYLTCVPSIRTCTQYTINGKVLIVHILKTWHDTVWKIQFDRTGRSRKRRHVLIIRSLYTNIAEKELRTYRVLSVDMQGTSVALLHLLGRDMDLYNEEAGLFSSA
jgi:hypothetical protein